MYPPAARCAAFPLGQVRHHQAPPITPYTADADPKNAFDIEAFLSTRLKLKPNEVYDVYEVDAEGV